MWFHALFLTWLNHTLGFYFALTGHHSFMWLDWFSSFVAFVLSLSGFSLGSQILFIFNLVFGACNAYFSCGHSIEVKNFVSSKNFNFSITWLSCDHGWGPKLSINISLPSCMSGPSIPNCLICMKVFILLSTQLAAVFS